MCLGIPAQVIDTETGHPDLVLADVSGARREVNLGILGKESVASGDWIVIHMGFALEKISAAEAADALDALEAIGPGAGAPDAVEWGPPW